MSLKKSEHAATASSRCFHRRHQSKQLKLLTSRSLEADKWSWMITSICSRYTGTCTLWLWSALKIFFKLQIVRNGIKWNPTCWSDAAIKSNSMRHMWTFHFNVSGWKSAFIWSLGHWIANNQRRTFGVV